jgi:nucleoside-diphosphate-sugar epimerase
LILGGTKFLGRAIAEEGLVRGHELTLFNRGETNPGLFPETEQLRGDRKRDLSALEGRTWDAVIDTSGYVPADVRAAAELLRESGRYVFVSSVSAYADFSTGPTEVSPVAELNGLPVDALASDYSNYGPLKALCEIEVERVFGERALIVRPGLIVGPHDPSGRFTYWAHRLGRGGEILAPGPQDRHAQFVDVRDLAIWILDVVERELSGTFNATNEGVPWRDLLAGAEVTWVSDDFLREHEIGEWMELPLWLADPGWKGMQEVDVRRAVAVGLRFRPVEQTIAGAATAPAVEGVGLTAEREAELLEAWSAR